MTGELHNVAISICEAFDALHLPGKLHMSFMVIGDIAIQPD